MNICTIGNFTYGWDGSICDEEHIAQALEDLGHNVYRVARDMAPNKTMWQEKMDFVLISQWDGYPEDMIDVLKKLYQCPIVYWAFDYQDWEQEWHRTLVDKSSLYLSKRIADSYFDNWQWLSQDFAPAFLDKAPTVDQDIDVLFTGSYLPWAKERTEILKAVDEHYNLVIHSFTPDQWKAEGLKNVEGPKMDEELPGLIARAKINLSIDHTIEAGYWSDRNAQIMSCNGFVLFHYAPLSEARFGDRIAYFYNKEDCLEQIGKYLDNDDRRKFIADLGYQHAYNYLKVEHRVRDMLKIVGSIL